MKWNPIESIGRVFRPSQPTPLFDGNELAVSGKTLFSDDMFDLEKQCRRIAPSTPTLRPPAPSCSERGKALSPVLIPCDADRKSLFADANRLIGEHRYEEAAGIAEGLLARQRDDPYALVLRARAREGSGDYAGAARDYKTASPSIKSNYSRIRYAYCVHRLGDHLDGIRMLDEATKCSWHDSAARAYQLHLLLITGNVDQARSTLPFIVRPTHANNVDRRIAYVWRDEGQIHLIDGRYDAAIKALDEYILLKPADGYAYALRAVALEALGKHVEAGADSAAAVKRSVVPEDVTTWVHNIRRRQPRLHYEQESHAQQ